MPRVTITVPDRTPQPYRFQLDRRTVTLGRGSENDIAIDCSSVSVKHAEMVRVEGGYEIRDLGSTNGTKIDEQRRMTIPLVDDTTVHLGDVAFYFQLSEEEQGALYDEAPVAAPVAKEPRRETSMAGSSGSSGLPGTVMLLLFIVLAAGAFFGGLAIRHQKDTGRSLLGDLGKKPAPTEAPAAPAAPAGDLPAPAPAPAPTPAPAPDAAAPTEPGK